MGKPTELMQLLKTGNSDAARKLIAKMKKSGEFVDKVCYSYIAMCVLIQIYSCTVGGLKRAFETAAWCVVHMEYLFMSLSLDALGA